MPLIKTILNKELKPTYTLKVTRRSEEGNSNNIIIAPNVFGVAALQLAWQPAPPLMGVWRAHVLLFYILFPPPSSKK